MKPRNAPAALAAARAELETAKAKIGELEAKLTEALAGDGAIEGARKIRAELATARDDVESLTQRVKIRETEHRTFVRAEREEQLKKNLEVADRLMARTIAAENKKIEAATALAKAAKSADEVHQAMRRDWPAGLAYPDMSTVRTATDRRFKDGFTRPGARLPDLMTIVGDLGRQIEEAGIASLTALRAASTIDDDEIPNLEEHAA